MESITATLRKLQQSGQLPAAPAEAEVQPPAAPIRAPYAEAYLQRWLDLRENLQGSHALAAFVELRKTEEGLRFPGVLIIVKEPEGATFDYQRDPLGQLDWLERRLSRANWEFQHAANWYVQVWYRGSRRAAGWREIRMPLVWGRDESGEPTWIRELRTWAQDDPEGLRGIPAPGGAGKIEL